MHFSHTFFQYSGFSSDEAETWGMIHGHFTGYQMCPSGHIRTPKTWTAFSRCDFWRFLGQIQPKIAGKLWMFIPSHLGFRWISWCPSCCDQLAPTTQAQLIPWCHRPSHLSRQVFQVDIFAPYPTIGYVRRFNKILSEILWGSLKINGSAKNI